MTNTTRPLPAGSTIEYMDIEATVIHDDGGSTILVECEGIKQNWFWYFEGRECRVVSVSEVTKRRSHRVMWVVEALDDDGWRSTEWVGATRERAREQAKEWKAETTMPVRVVKYAPANK